MTEQPVPIAYTALTPGTPMQTADGDQFGVVETVLAVTDLDVFDGITVRTDDGGLRFCDADTVRAITTAYVRTTLSAEDIQSLPEPAAAPSYRVDPTDDTGSSIGDRLGRMFGKGKWKPDK